LQILGGIIFPFWFILVVGELIARISQAFRMNVGRMSGSKAKFRPEQMTAIVIEHRRFPMIFGPAFFLDSMSTLVQTAMIGALFGPVEMGLYFLMRRTLDLPVAFAFRSLSDAFFAKQLALAREAPDQLTKFFVKMSGLLAILGIGVSWPLFLWGAELFELFYGPEWALAGELAATMVVPIVLNLAVAPVARVFQLSRWSQLRIIPSIINIVGSLVLLYFAISYDFEFRQTVTGIAIVTTILYVSYFASGILASKQIRVEYDNAEK
jgi:O-antigen/teichoic acid export membrane protein